MTRTGKLPVPILDIAVAATSMVAIIVSFSMWVTNAPGLSVGGRSISEISLFVALAAAAPLIWRIGKRIARFEMTADLLAAVSIVAAVLLGEYLAGTIVVLMLSGGEALEALAVRKASFALDALAKRLPSAAHLRGGGDVRIDDVEVGDEVLINPYEICPVDGVVIEGHSTMNEAYLTGEPFVLPKAVGSMVLSGAVNGEGLLTVKAEKLASDSRYSRIMEVMRDAEEKRPQIRRLGDRIGAIYTVVIMAIAIAAWIITGTPERF